MYFLLGKIARASEKYVSLITILSEWIIPGSIQNGKGGWSSKSSVSGAFKTIKGPNRQGGLDESIHIFIHRPFERWSIRKQEAKLIITETASPSSWVCSPQILCSQPISTYLVSKMLNGTYLQRQD